MYLLITEAYQILGDPERRRYYDYILEDAFDKEFSQDDNNDINHDLDDILMNTDEYNNDMFMFCLIALMMGLSTLCLALLLVQIM
jgi:DnaJ-class molecular chaperone